jgi:TolA-binding protein
MSSRGIVLMLVAVVLAGCGEKVSPRAQQELDASTAAYEAGNYAAVIQHANAVLAETDSGEAAWEAHYLRGMARYHQDDLAGARSDLAVAVDKTGQTSLAVKAADALGEIAYRQDDLPAAVTQFQTVIDRGEEKQPPVDHAHYRLGCIYQRQSRGADADLHFQRLGYHFPDGKLAKLAAERSGARNWTIQAGSFTERENAMSAMKLFPITGPRPFVEQALRDGERQYLLMIGKWNDYTQAEAALPSVRQIKPDAFLNVVR